MSDATLIITICNVIKISPTSNTPGIIKIHARFQRFSKIFMVLAISGNIDRLAKSNISGLACL